MRTEYGVCTHSVKAVRTETTPRDRHCTLVLLSSNLRRVFLVPLGINLADSSLPFCISSDFSASSTLPFAIPPRSISSISSRTSLLARLSAYRSGLSPRGSGGIKKGPKEGLARARSGQPAPTIASLRSTCAPYRSCRRHFCAFWLAASLLPLASCLFVP